MTDLKKAAQQALEAMEDLHRTGDTQVFDLCHRETTEALRAALEQPEQPNPWRDAVDHELSTLHMVASDDPRESIRRLIDWHCAVQIDPLVSSAAQELIERGRREALEQPEQDTDCHAQGICQRSGYGIKQPEQEPVAWWIVSKTTDEEFVSVRPNDWSDINWEKHPLYTHPPRREWRSLSEEEFGYIYVFSATHEKFACAIEAALRSKNHE
jgi:hypothetical protein